MTFSIQNIKNRLKHLPWRTNTENNLTHDQVKMDFYGFTLSVDRETNSTVPSELSVIVPRVEYRERFTDSQPPVYEKEIIISSVTVVVSPRHEPEDPAEVPVIEPRLKVRY